MPEISEPLNFARVGGKSKMERRNSARRALVSVSLTVCLVVVTAGLTCPPTGGDISGLNPPVPPGNRPPRVLITAIDTPLGNLTAEIGELVTISFTGEDGEDTATVRIFASTSSNPSPSQTIPILSNFAVGPGVGSGTASWNTAGVSPAAYNIFAEIDDHSFDPSTGVGNPPIRVVSAAPVQVVPPGTTPLSSPPQIVLTNPRPNLGLASQDDVTVRYIYADLDSGVTVTLLLDKDLNPTNDDINNPGDPFDPNTKIIILPSSALLPGDPPGDAGLRANPRTFPNPTTQGIFPYPGAPLAGVEIEYHFKIDFSKIPVQSQPYYIRATITDGDATRHAYATGSLTISRYAQGTVDVSDLGFTLAGARFQGFSAFENFGTDFVDATDLDADGAGDFLIASRFGSPRNRFQPGAAYLIFGRPKVPFPPDTNGNGLPDTPGPGGGVVDYPAVPDYLPNPYDPQNVGRFGGIISINSVSTFFRGTTYAMPAPRFSAFNPPPPAIEDPDHIGIGTAGLTSITRIDMTGDGIADLVFGLPYISGAYDHIDDDPSDGGCDAPYGYNPNSCPACFVDREPNYNRCDEGGQHGNGNDDMGINIDETGLIGAGDLDQGLVIGVDGTNDIRNIFRKFVDAGLAGQFDPGGAIDDEFVIHGDDTIPRGFRMRGGWFPEEFVGGGPFELRITHDNEYGETVSALKSIDNDLSDELLVSIPGHEGERGQILVWLGEDYTNEGHYASDKVRSLPAIGSASDCGGDACFEDIIPPVMPGGTPTTVTYCARRCYIATPVSVPIIGEAPNDRLGFAGPAGDFNQDGVDDITAGAPGASRNGFFKNGIFYVFFSPVGGFGPIDLGVNPPPHIKIIGTHDNDQFGRKQTRILDINGDNIDDVAFSSENFDFNITGSVAEEADVGYVGIIFGQRDLTGENTFAPLDVGTAVIPGVKFFGAVPGALAGHDLASAGDFNNDGFGDLLVSCPGETRTVGSQTRRGVVYLIFGGQHLTNQSFNLSQVGTSALPGIVFIGRSYFQDPISDPAPLETVGGIGDIDGDGFDDIMIGAPHFDFVNAASPNQRRLDAGEAYLIYGSNSGTNALP